MELAVVYPVYNEAEIIEDTAEKTIEFLEEKNIDGKIVFITDGSTDGTKQIADKLHEKHGKITHISHGEKLGKGKAFEKAFRETEAKKYIYSDPDLSTELKHIEDAVKHTENNDIAVGSRRIEKGFDRGLKREVPSIIFNELLRKTFLSDLRDHQCGFKAFNAESVEDLFDEVESSHWFWDAEMLIKAQRKDLDVKEFPVDWEESSESKVSVVRDSFYFLKKTAELRYRLWT